jgi:hypothetical protein
MHIYLSCISLFTVTTVIQLSFKPIKINFNDLPWPTDPDLNVLKYYFISNPWYWIRIYSIASKLKTNLFHMWYGPIPKIHNACGDRGVFDQVSQSVTRGVGGITWGENVSLCIKKQDLACKYVALRRQINVFCQNILPECERTWMERPRLRHWNSVLYIQYIIFLHNFIGVYVNKRLVYKSKFCNNHRRPQGLITRRGDFL